MSKKNEKHEQGSPFNPIKFFGVLFSKFGAITGTCVFLIYLIINYATPTQKEELIDTWILFKAPASNFAFVIVTIFLIVLLASQQILWSSKLKAMQSRMDAIAEEKSRLQEDLTNKRLKSTNPKQQ